MTLNCIVKTSINLTKFPGNISKDAKDIICENEGGVFDNTKENFIDIIESISEEDSD